MFNSHSSAVSPFSDDALLDELFDTQVYFEWTGAAGYYARITLIGTVIDVCTSRRGVRQLLVKAQELNVPHWLPLSEIQFVPQKQTAEAVASAVA